jgi:transposase
MAGKVEKTCGADIHKDFLIATILSTDGLKLQHRFDTHLDGLLEFKSWLNEISRKEGRHISEEC